MTASHAQRRAELYLRGDTYGTYDAQQDVLSRLRDLAAGETLASASIGGEWQRIRTVNEDRRSGALATYEEFEDWARQNGFSLEPAFERRTRSYVGMDRVDEVVVFPVASVAMYEGTRLQAVFPCSDEERSFGVTDCLDALERGDEEWLRQFDAVTVGRTSPWLEPEPA